MTVPFYEQPPFSKNIQTTYGGFNSAQYGILVHGFMEWDSSYASNTVGYSQPAMVNFQFNPSTLAVSYYSQTSTNAVTDYMFSVQSVSATPLAAMQQSITFSLLYDRTYELWGSYNVDGTPANGGTAASPGNINDPTQVGVGADILAMQQFTGMLEVQDTGTGNAGAIPAGGSANTLKPQLPLIFIPSWVYFGQSVAGLYYYGFVSDWEVQITQWTQYMIPMRCVINVDFTLLPTPAEGGEAAGPGESATFWSASPLGTSAAAAAAAAGTTTTAPGVAPGSAGGIRG